MKKIFEITVVEITMNFLVGLLIANVFYEINVFEGMFITFAFSCLTSIVVCLSHKINNYYGKKSTYYARVITEAVIINILFSVLIAKSLLGESYIEAIRNFIGQYREIALAIALLTVVKVLVFQSSLERKNCLLNFQNDQRIKNKKSLSVPL